MASTYLERTLSTPTNNKIWTYSAWLKLASAGSATESPLSSGTDANNRGIIYFNGGNNEIQYYEATSGTTSIHLTTNRLFRDISAWYHIVLSVDTTQATDSNRVKIYVNGVQETSLATATYPTLDYNTKINSAVNMSIGSANSYGGALHFNGSMAHINFIDGLAYDASAFGETNAASGIWTPIASPSVTYGTNGFFLKFGSSGALGTDSSGNSNTFTVNGSGTQTQDAPSNVFATMNPLFAGDPNLTYSVGNLKLTATSENQKNSVSTLAVSSGKYYCEMVSKVGTNYPGFGIMDIGSVLQTSVLYLGSSIDSYCMFQDGNYYTNGSAVSTGVTWGVDSIMGVAIDLDSATKTIKFYKNGVEQHSATIATPANGYVFAVSHNTNGTISEINFGNGYFGTTAVASGNADGAGYGIFEYAPPTGYYSLCTKNINTYG